MGRPVEELEAMIQAADPVHGDAPSFDAERSVRKHIGDYALLCRRQCIQKLLTPCAAIGRHHPSLGELIRAGKESYFIVSQFNLCEYAEEAPLFARLSQSFERCILGLTLRCAKTSAPQASDAPPASVLSQNFLTKLPLSSERNGAPNVFQFGGG